MRRISHGYFQSCSNFAQELSPPPLPTCLLWIRRRRRWRRQGRFGRLWRRVLGRRSGLLVRRTQVHITEKQRVLIEGTLGQRRRPRLGRHGPQRLQRRPRYCARVAALRTRRVPSRPGPRGAGGPPPRVGRAVQRVERPARAAKRWELEPAGEQVELVFVVVDAVAAVRQAVFTGLTFFVHRFEGEVGRHCGRIHCHQSTGLSTYAHPLSSIFGNDILE